MTKEKFVREKPIPEVKIRIVKELSEKMQKSRTVLLASCKGLPGKQFHEIKKKLRGKAEIRVAKISSVHKAIDSIERGTIKNLKSEVGADVVLFFSDMDPFELSGLLSDSQSPAKAKAGDIAPRNIEIEPGPTELIPGPAISELGSVGLKIIVKEGKLEIQRGAVVAKEGEVITPKVASVLGKLNIKPLKVGFIPLVAYDAKEDKIYLGIKVDKEAVLNELRDSVKKSLGFAVSIGYPTKETITYFISKAYNEAKALEIVARKDEVNEKTQEVAEEKEQDLNSQKKEEIKE